MKNEILDEMVVDPSLPPNYVVMKDSLFLLILDENNNIRLVRMDSPEFAEAAAKIKEISLITFPANPLAFIR